MTEPQEQIDIPQMVRREHSTDRSITGNSAPVATGGDATIHDRLGVYVAIIALIIASLALGMVIMLPAQQAARVAVLADRTANAERELRLLQLKYDDMRVALELKGIDPNQHTKGQSP
jgi:hypothetical protein